MSDAPRTVHEGSAKNWQRRPPEERAEGDDILLRHAILDAYANARAAHDPSRSFRVVEIFVDGSNPPSDYRAHIVAHP